MHGLIGTAVRHGKILVGIYKYLTVMYFLYSKKDQYEHLNEMLSVMESVVEVCDKLGDHKFSSFNYLLFIGFVPFVSKLTTFYNHCYT